MTIEYDPSIHVEAPQQFVSESDLPNTSTVAMPTLQTFVAPSGEFSLQMPGIPVEQVQSIATEIGTLEIHIFMVDLPNAAYLVSYTDYPAEIITQLDPQTLLDGARDDELNKIEGAIIEEIPADLNGHPGRAVRAAIANGQGIIRFRHYLVGNRLYQVAIIGDPTAVVIEQATTFLNSLRLINP